MQKNSSRRIMSWTVSLVLLTFGLAALTGAALARKPAKKHHKSGAATVSPAIKAGKTQPAAEKKPQPAPEPPAQPAAGDQTATPRRAATLAEHRKLWAAYVSAQAKHRAALNVYWKKIAAKRAIRKRKLVRRHSILHGDYVLTQPPAYRGPPMPVSFFKPDKNEKPAKTEPRKTLPVLADFLMHARAEYGFTPRRVSEIEFKRRYAREALALGLTRDQVVRLYAFETGGFGAHDMQAGFDPKTGKVYPVSTALGYAQLLNANSVGEVAEHGDAFADRLEKLAQTAGVDSARAAELRAKAASVRAMFRWASAQSDSWNEQVRLSSTPKGQGVHALNVDSDVGPWLQVSKLAAIRTFAARKGRRELTAAQLELMNLAGPGRGFEMMQPHLKDLPTANFFERAAYERNPVTNYRTGAQLLAKIEALMEKNLKRDGAQEFVAAFERP